MKAMLLAAGAMAPAAIAQDPPAAGDWPMYSLNHAGNRFSPLTQIDTSNVAELAEAWSVPVARSATDNDDAPGPSGNALATLARLCPSKRPSRVESAR